MKLFFKKSDNCLDEAIKQVLKKMKQVEPDSDEYGCMADNLEKLYKAKQLEKAKEISPDTILMVVANLVGIVIVLKHEQINVIAGKAFGLILKGRV